MEVSADGIRQKSSSYRPLRDGPKKTAAAVTNVKEHTAPPRLCRPWLYFSGEAIDQLDLPVVVHVGVNVAGPQMVQQLFLCGAAGVGEDLVVHHDWNVRPTARLYCPIDGGPSRLRKMRRFDAHDGVLVAQDRLRCSGRIHVADVALVRLPDHAFADNVEERQHSRFRAGDDRPPELVKCPPTATACIDNRGR